jgi:hypothetical protein
MHIVQIWLSTFITACNKQCESMSFLQSYFICHPPHVACICVHMLSSTAGLTRRREVWCSIKRLVEEGSKQANIQQYSSKMKHCWNTGVWVVYCIQGQPRNSKQSSHGPTHQSVVNHIKINNTEQLILDKRHTCVCEIWQVNVSGHSIIKIKS